MKTIGSLSTACLPDARLDPPDDYWLDEDSSENEAEYIANNIDRMASCIANDDYNLSSLTAGDDKIIKLYGKRYTVYESLLIAACALNPDERAVILDDVRTNIERFLACQIEKGIK